jgi:hypothetical protein
MSLGLTANYLLSVNTNPLNENPAFGDRMDLKARFNANLEMQLEPNMDVYPGLDWAQNFVAHLGEAAFEKTQKTP